MWTTYWRGWSAWTADLTQVSTCCGLLRQTAGMVDRCRICTDIHPALAALDAAQLDAMMLRTRRTALVEGEVLFKQGDPAQRFYRVTRGLVKLFRLSPQGQEKVIEIIGPGQSFAEAAMFTKNPVYPVWAGALEDAEVEGFDGPFFRSLIDRSPQVALEMLRILSVRQHKLISEIESLSLQNATLRVACYIMQSAESAGGKSEIKLASQKRVIASRLSTQPETLSRIFTAMEKAGILTIRGSSITIERPDDLAAVASGEARLA